MSLELTTRDESILQGHEGEAKKFAMDMVVRAAEIMGAPHLIDVSFLHVDACHYYGRAHLDFAQYLVANNARFDIPAWTNTLVVNLDGPDIRPDADPTFKEEARALPQLYEAMGAKPVWTCAPYQLPGGPAFGDQIIGSESNAVAYYNSAVGARTNKYGDFLEVCAGLVARTPFAGLHTDEGRRGTVLLDATDIAIEFKREDLFFHVLGHLTGKLAGTGVPVIKGLPTETNKDQLKAMSAAVAASGGVALFHALGVTPEASDLDTVFQGVKPVEKHTINMDMLVGARNELSTINDGPLEMVAIGTPHFSFTEFRTLVDVMDGRRINRAVTFYVTTSRFVRDMAAAEGWIVALEHLGITIVVDTCTYFMPGVKNCRGRVMTNSAKWAYYAPGMLPVDGIVFGSLRECVESAIKGDVWRDRTLVQIMS